MAKNIFQSISLTKPKRSVFDMSYDHKTSFKMGKLIPIHLQECIPGDKFHISTEAMFRMQPMLAPIMHKVDVYVHHFFVPNRIIWDGWEKFITGGQDGDVPPAFPVMDNTLLNVTSSSVGDYLGLPLGDYALNNDSFVSALPFMAYQRIWADYYRDQNLQDLGNDALKCTDGVQGPLVMDLLTTLRERAWEHDYFTSALPFAQKGDAVELPIDLAGDLEVKADPMRGDPSLKRFNTGALIGGREMGSHPANGRIVADQGQPSQEEAFYDPLGNMYVEGDDLSTSTTINDLRTAFQTQKWLELAARVGSRYKEMLWGFFGVKSSDKRLQRPEYLGGSKASMAISEVLQTSSSVEDSPQGAMAGHGISVTSGKACSHFCEEHGYMMSILSVRPKTAYFQGLPRHFSKLDRLDYYFPQFAFLGEQEIKVKEVMLDNGGMPNQNNNTFGYIPRYSEYRYNAGRVSGDMKTSLKYWHLAREFAGVPTLSAEFIQCDPSKRIFAVEDENADEIVGHIYHKIKAVRPMPKYGNPGGI